MLEILHDNNTPRFDAPDEVLRHYYRYPAGTLGIQVNHGVRKLGFFRFGPATYFGGCTLQHIPESLGKGNAPVPDATSAMTYDSDGICLPFNPGEIVDNLRLERYMSHSSQECSNLLKAQWVRNAYYLFRKFMPVHIRKHLQRMHLADWHRISFPNWPVDCSVDLMFEQLLRLAIHARGGTRLPFIWFWPEGHSACLIMTHDVEQRSGRDFCSTLMKLEEEAGFRASFQIIPEERYDVPPSFLDEIRKRGHEINVHDLNHDGHLFRDRGEFLRRAAKIRMYAKQFGAEGFRSAILYRNLDWLQELDFNYDMSVPNVAHLDPQRGGCCTVMPYFIGRMLELPLTTTQDYSLFHILKKTDLQLWNEQINRILVSHGLLSFNIHPDYVMKERTLSIYKALLSRLAAVQAQHNLWAALPREVNVWWRQRSQMELAHDGRCWRILGQGSERARVAYAAIEDGRLVYSIE